MCICARQNAVAFRTKSNLEFRASVRPTYRNFGVDLETGSERISGFTFSNGVTTKCESLPLCVVAAMFGVQLGSGLSSSSSSSSSLIIISSSSGLPNPTSSGRSRRALSLFPSPPRSPCHSRLKSALHFPSLHHSAAYSNDGSRPAHVCCLQPLLPPSSFKARTL